MNNSTKMPRLFLSLFLLITATVLEAQTQGQFFQNIQTSVSADILASGTLLPEDQAPIPAYNGLKVRTAEFLFYGPIDQNFDGVVNFAAHSEGDIVFSLPEVHEAYVMTSKIIPRSRIKLGQYFLGIGRLNKFHQHDWPFITVPLTQLNIFDSKEGIIDTGIEYSYLLPSSRYWDLTFGVTNGRTFGHSHGDGPLPLWPTTYARLSTYLEILGLMTETGVSTLYRQANNQTKTTLVGYDLTSKMRYGQILRYLIQGEIWWKRIEPKLGEKSEMLSAYLYGRYGFMLNWSTGLRVDYSTVLSSGSNHEVAIECDLAWQASEFSRFTLGYYHYLSSSKIEAEGKSSQILLQTVYILGAHPAHEF